jgi:glycosyltransferase involved in cell wall biosynthesis
VAENTRRLPRVLVIAYACEPNASSEPAVGWHFVREIANFARLTVITRTNNREAIGAALAQESTAMRERVTWVYTEGPVWAKRLKKRLFYGIQWYYALWQRRALTEARRLVKVTHFDFVHHLTFGVVWLAPTAARLPLPLLWGPIGGGMDAPRALLADESWLSHINEWAYRALSMWWVRFSPMAKRARERALIILFRTRSGERAFPATPHTLRRIICETAAPAPPCLRNYTRPNALRALCVGRLLYSKGVIFALRGFHEFVRQGGEGTLTFLGSGPELNRLRDYVDRNSLDNLIFLRGQVSREEVQALMRESDVLIHPSFREGGSWAVLEAMCNGLVPICMRVGGLADMVDDSSGIFVRGNNPDMLTLDIGNALARLWNDPELMCRLSAGAQARVADEYNWGRRGQQIREVYAEMMGRL